MATAVLSDDAEEFLSWLTVERGRAELTVMAYRRDLAAYESPLRSRHKTVLGASLGDVEDHLAELRKSGHGAASVARSQSVLRGLHHFLVEEHRAPIDPTAE